VPILPAAATLGHVRRDDGSPTDPGQTLRSTSAVSVDNTTRWASTDEVFHLYAGAGPGPSVAWSPAKRRNRFGLWVQVVSLRASWLAARCAALGDGCRPGAWSARTAVRLAAAEAGVFEAEAAAGAVALRPRLRSRRRLYEGGNDAAPGAAPAEIKRLWIEVPLATPKRRECTRSVTACGRNYAATAPPGQGCLGRQPVVRHERWGTCSSRTSGGLHSERGFGFLCREYQGWVTEKGHSKTPTHTWCATASG